MSTKIISQTSTPSLETPSLENQKKSKLWLWLVLTPLIIFWLVAVVVTLVLRKKFLAFEKTSGFTFNQLQTIVKEGYEKSQLYQAQNKTDTTILLLGVDSLDNRGDIPPLTDTMMIVRLNFTNGLISVLSLPRDIWSEAYQTKINALLAYGFQRDANNPTAFPAKVISELTGIDLDHTLVLSMEQLEDLINLLEGVEIDVPVAFTDEQFPRDDVDIYTEFDPNKLYETIHFSAGKQIMDGKTALKYIRSRKSADAMGTDIARGERQQQVFEALFLKMKNYRFFYNKPEVAGKLLRYYYDNYNQYFSFTDMVATMSALIPVIDHLEIVGQTLSTNPNDPNGVLYNPPYFKFQNLWVYTINDIKQFQQEILYKLNNRSIPLEIDD